MTVVEFHEQLLACVEKNELTEKDIAHAIDVARPTVQHWIEGSTFPHIALRGLIIERLKETKGEEKAAT